MGVKGLTSFIDDNPVLLQDFKLSNCKVILDGNNFIHFVYQNYNESHQYDGDYHNYYRKIVQLFNSLKQCNVEAIVIFDGGYDVSDSKLRTTLDRAERRVIQASNNCSLLPIMAGKAFRKALDQLDVFHVTCSFEADEEIAILANQWNCPVISNDSDFFVYNLKAGFLPLNYVDFRPKKLSARVRYISAQKYHFDHYDHILDNFQPEMIPLIATVLGNDFIKYDTFSVFTQKFNRQKYKIKSASNAVSKITAILNYFDQFKTFEEGRNAITKDFVTSGGVASLQHVIDQSLNSYMKIDSKKSIVADVVKNTCDWKKITQNDYFNQPLPQWFIHSLFQGEISPLVQNMAVLHRVFLPCQQEQITQQSSHKLTMFIRQVLYGVLFQGSSKVKETKNGRKRKSNRNTQVEEVDRSAKSIGHFYIDPRENLTNHGRLPSLSEVGSLSENQKCSIMIHTLGVAESFVSKFSPVDQLLMCVLSYWVSNSNVSLIQLEAIVLTIIFLKMRCLDQNNEEVKQKLGMSNLFHNNVQSIDEVSDRLPIEVLHSYAQYQSCLLFTLLLNELLQSPFQEPILWQVYDGAVAYHFNKCLVLRHAGCPDKEDILKTIEKYPKLVKLYKYITQTIMNDAKTRPKKLTKSEKRKAKSAMDNLNNFTGFITKLGYMLVILVAVFVAYSLKNLNTFRN
ncbi:hypothetical protein LOTGIDRAFT_122662 [Lottia gigantea]|uniref:XPG N-terminal domain-containing protein n=1 Tax=Lottia gigantea TaxID=225164 RepID=V4AC27_LOTGI|nr:hypothetical protein LOTGIDRAFT_122662 [Lottia gigantea]ESO90831.1 hypothetical protein LOTGIDRAFT_122662 [Lottia gigantea]